MLVVSARRSSGSGARSYLAGYPPLPPAAGVTSAHTLGLTDGDLAFINGEELRLNTMPRQRARAAGVYAGTCTPSPAPTRTPARPAAGSNRCCPNPGPGIGRRTPLRR
jgi:hypothetical protein